MEQYTTVHTVAHAAVTSGTAKQAQEALLAVVQAITPGAEVMLLVSDRFAYTFRVWAPWSLAVENSFIVLYGESNIIRS